MEEVEEEWEGVVEGRDEDLAKVEMATLAVMLAVSVIGNGAVLVALWARPRPSPLRRLSRMHLLVMHLCAADLITAAFTVLPQMAWEATYRFAPQAAPLCKPLKVLQLLGPYLSSYLLVAMAIDRHRAVCRPLSVRAFLPRSPRRLVAVAWVLSFLFSLPQAFVFSYQKVNELEWDCWATFEPAWTQKAYVTWYGVSVFAVPLVLLLYCYAGICRALRRNHREKTRPLEDGLIARGSPPRTHSVGTISRAKMRTLRLTIVAVACYILCSCPFVLSQLWATWYPGAMESTFWREDRLKPAFYEKNLGKLQLNNKDQIDTVYRDVDVDLGAAFTILSLLPCLNSCVNPWIYMAFNEDIRIALKERLPERVRKLTRPLFIPDTSKRVRHHDTNLSATSSSRTRSSRSSPPPELRTIANNNKIRKDHESIKLNGGLDN